MFAKQARLGIQYFVQETSRDVAFLYVFSFVNFAILTLSVVGEPLYPLSHELPFG